MGKNFGKMPNMNEVNKFVKSGAFNKQMQQHMPQIMEKVKKVDTLSKGQGMMDDSELELFVGKIYMELQKGGILDKGSYLKGVKIAVIAAGYDTEWVTETLMTAIKQRIEA